MNHSLRTLVVGCGHMGTSHALAYQDLPEFQVIGVVSRGPKTREQLAAKLGGVPTFDNFEGALETSKPDVVCIATYPDTHTPYATRAMKQGADVFVEKPLAETVDEARTVVATAEELGRRLVVGYILRQHPSWIKFIRLAKTLGKPLVMRMNLNQQSNGDEWKIHRKLMKTMSPIVDCGVHYVDIMCQMTGARPVRVHAVGARLSDEIAEEMYNYGQLQVQFDDGSCGWYEAGWGPMMSETAYFVKDVIGPRGSVSIVSETGNGSSADVDMHTRTNRLRIHYSELDDNVQFTKGDEVIDMEEEPGHLELCRREQQFLLRAIRGEIDITGHLANAVDSLRIVLAADESVRTGKSVELS